MWSNETARRRDEIEKDKIRWDLIWSDQATASKPWTKHKQTSVGWLVSHCESDDDGDEEEQKETTHDQVGPETKLTMPQWVQQSKEPLCEWVLINGALVIPLFSASKCVRRSQQACLKWLPLLAKIVGLKLVGRNEELKIRMPHEWLVNGSWMLEWQHTQPTILKLTATATTSRPVIVCQLTPKISLKRGWGEVKFQKWDSLRQLQGLFLGPDRTRDLSFRG